jgi:hypothetical protein
MLPSAYYVACRDADKAIRPISLRAAVHYLTHTLSVEPAQLSVVIAAIGEESGDYRVDEFRIGYSVGDSQEVFYGVVWPLYDEETAEEFISSVAQHRPVPNAPLSPLQQIIAVLRDTGITRFQQVQSLMPAEYCDDCGSPLFCNSEEEMVHAEMPEDAQQNTGHLH